ncbi:hypothetical protein ASZ90_011419 [hydrocarbon metagenome]|uniref:Uncharacterized protein n=1 Tax=hydrocarbon metagenome TaxID=938273 RepID=A0A0W8FDF1_9ZZZZ
MLPVKNSGLPRDCPMPVLYIGSIRRTSAMTQLDVTVLVDNSALFGR